MVDKDTIHVTEALVDYALNSTYEKLTQKAIDVEKHSLNDSIACMVAAAGMDEPGRAISRYAERIPGNCTLYTTDKKVDPVMAALANGSLAHAMDFDDAHKSIVHSNACCTSALIALAEHMGNVSGEELLHTLVLGSDISNRIGFGLVEDILQYGWNSPAMCEALGAVISCGKLYGLNHDEMFDAIAMTMTQFVVSGESVKSKGSTIRTIREGFGAQAAVQSVLMAKYGIHSRFEYPLEGESGFYFMYARGNYSPERIIEGLGEKYTTEDITYKPWPACRATHTTIETMIDLVNKYDLKPEDILSYHISANSSVIMVMDPKEAKCHPETPAIAKASLPFQVGTVAKYRTVDLDSYTEERLHDEDIQRVAERVSYEVNPNLGKEDSMVADITVVTTKGEFTTHIESAIGDVDKPMTEKMIRDKFFTCCRKGPKNFSEEHIERLSEVIAHVETLENINTLTELL